MTALGQGTSQNVNTAIEQVLQKQVEAWNRHDLEGFMEGYRNSPDLTFLRAAMSPRGWQAAMNRYRERYQGQGRDGQLGFSDLRTEMLGPDVAFVGGSWHLIMPDGKTPQGLFTLILRKFPDGWKIVHDHTSTAE